MALSTLLRWLYHQIVRQLELNNRLRRYLDIPVAGQSRDGGSSATPPPALRRRWPRHPPACLAPILRQLRPSNVCPCPSCCVPSPASPADTVSHSSSVRSTAAPAAICL